jgi:hypothetical protein
MKVTDVYWSFLNEDSELQTDGLTFQQAKFVADLIPQVARASWLVWHEGILDWIVLEECIDLMSSSPEDSKYLPPFPPERKSKVPAAGGGQTPNANARSTAQIDKRVNRRFFKKFGLEIIWPGVKFVTTTVNISMGGILLVDEIPEPIGKTFNVLLSRKDGTQIKIFCAQLRPPKSDSGGSKRLRIIGAEHEGLLHNWLLDSLTE